MRYLFVLLILLPVAVWGADLTPSVNYFAYDYDAIPTSDEIDSIIAWRYEVLIADISFGTGYGTKYSELYAHDPSTQFYTYVDGMDGWSSTGALGPIIEAITPYLPGTDSTLAFYHSADTADYDTCGGVATRVAYGTDEFHSRLLTYAGGCPEPRSIPKWSAPGYPTAFANYYAAPLKAKHDTASWTLTGIWFDNRGIPQTGELLDCSELPLLYETNLGGDTVHWGCETQTDGNRTYHTNFLSVELVHYTKVMADTIAALTGLKTTVNAVGFSDEYESVYFHGRHAEYYVADSQGVDRSQEWTGSTTRNGVFSPGPTNAATSIDSATVCAVLSPIDIYTEVQVLDADGFGEWFNPNPLGYVYHYPFSDQHYYDLCLYYLWRGRYTHLSFQCDPSGTELNWISGGASGGRCVGVGETGDSCYWIDALGERVGRDGKDAGWSTDTVRFYAASVTCTDCINTTGLGVDDAAQNWVVFSRQWDGDDDRSYLVLCRPGAANQTTYGTGTYTPPIPLPVGNWEKLDNDGDWTGVVAKAGVDSFFNGGGGIYREVTDDSCALVNDLTMLDSTINSFTVENDYATDSAVIDKIVLYYDDSPDMLSLKDSAVDITVLAPPDTLTITGLDSGSVCYYQWLTYFYACVDTSAIYSVIIDSGDIATCDLTSSISVVDTALTTFTVENDYSFGGTDSTIDFFRLIWDDDTYIDAPLDSVSVSTGITDPDYLQATGLDSITTYYYWWITDYGTCQDTSAMGTILTAGQFTADSALILTGADAWLSRWDDVGGQTGHTNRGGATTISPGGDQNDCHLLKFDLSGLPSEVTVTSVVCSLKMGWAGGMRDFAIGGRVTTNWTEGVELSDTVSAGNPGVTPSYSTDAPPARAGGSDTGWASTYFGTGDFTSERDTASAPSDTWVVFDGDSLIADVQGWIDGTFPNYGWVIFCPDYAESGRALNTFEAVDDQPRLLIHFSVGGVWTTHLKGSYFRSGYIGKEQ